MAQAEKDLQQPADDNARFALGIAQFIRAVEHVGGSLYKFGLRSDELTRNLPFARLPVPQNPNPQPVTADDVRAIFQTWLDDMDRVRQTLSQIREPEKVKLELPIGLVHLDLNGDDKAGEEESLWRVFQ